MITITQKEINEEACRVQSAWLDRIRVDPGICHGKVCIKGTRVLVSVILNNLAEDISLDEILEAYPTITKEDVHVALHYAAYLASERIIPLSSSTSEILDKMYDAKKSRTLKQQLLLYYLLYHYTFII